MAIYSEQVIAKSVFEDDVSEMIAEWDPSVSVVNLDATIDGDRATVRVDLSGPREPEPAWKLAEMLSQRRDVRVEVDVTFTLTKQDRAVSTD